jgi:hypothetical protein
MTTPSGVREGEEELNYKTKPDGMGGRTAKFKQAWG